MLQLVKLQDISIWKPIFLKFIFGTIKSNKHVPDPYIIMA